MVTGKTSDLIDSEISVSRKKEYTNIHGKCVIETVSVVEVFAGFVGGRSALDLTVS